MKQMIRTTAMVALGLAMAAPASAQFGSSLRGAGMAGAYVGLARGHDALVWNPANLALNGAPKWTLQLPNFHGNLGLLGTEFGSLQDDFLDADQNSDADRQRILNGVPTTGLEAQGSLQVPIAAFSMGNWAVGLSTTAQGQGSLSRELVDLYLYNAQYDDLDYDNLANYEIGNTQGRDARYTTITAGYGRALTPKLSVGVSGRMVLGHELQRFRVFEPRIDIENEEFLIPIAAVKSTGGTGFGVDIGAAYQPTSNITLGVSVQNALQRMSWNDDLEYWMQNYNAEELGRFRDKLDTETQPVDPAGVPLPVYEVARSLFSESFFPRIVRVGGAYDRGTTTIGATFSTTQGKGDLHTGWPTYVSVGVEQQLPVLRFMTVRGGYAVGSGASALSFGSSFNFGPVAMTLGVSNISGSGDGVGLGTFSTDHRFSERSAASTGYSMSFGFEVIGR